MVLHVPTGEDIVATHNVSGLTVRIEAKGARPGTNRFGKPFITGQCESHVARAFYKAVAMATKHPAPNERVGVAFPDSVKHRSCLRRIEPALKRLGITVFWVWPNGKVTTEGARLNALSRGDSARGAFDPIGSFPPEGALRQLRLEARRRGTV
jgi:hypothetical protein